MCDQLIRQGISHLTLDEEIKGDHFPTQERNSLKPLLPPTPQLRLAAMEFTIAKMLADVRFSGGSFCGSLILNENAASGKFQKNGDSVDGWLVRQDDQRIRVTGSTTAHLFGMELQLSEPLLLDPLPEVTGSIKVDIVLDRLVPSAGNGQQAAGTGTRVPHMGFNLSVWLCNGSHDGDVTAIALVLSCRNWQKVDRIKRYVTVTAMDSLFLEPVAEWKPQEVHMGYNFCDLDADLSGDGAETTVSRLPKGHKHIRVTFGCEEFPDLLNLNLDD